MLFCGPCYSRQPLPVMLTQRLLNTSFLLKQGLALIQQLEQGRLATYKNKAPGGKSSQDGFRVILVIQQYFSCLGTKTI